MFTELPREKVFAALKELEHCPPSTRMILVPTSNEVCVGFQVMGTKLAVFHRSIGGGTSVAYTLRSLVAELVEGQWTVTVNVKAPCPPAAAPERVKTGPLPVDAYKDSLARKKLEAERAEQLAAEQAEAQRRAFARELLSVRKVSLAAAAGGASLADRRRVARVNYTAVKTRIELAAAQAELAKLRAQVKGL